ncbi:dnaJ homolog subfamily C member 9-like [Gigantopelta aegis]|uniref:dnaJ homolog subfamily C member 9-like n=1 Tax=Gigantopelta aegis TaxID=1735272 RepID=UPI001B88CC00|nr:dnaJ homolog subfamily C member 9-like [Gigantopelta aegis]
MPSLLNSCKELFGTDNLYDILNIRNTASPQEVKKGYHKTSLKCHPDRVLDDEKDEATRKFQTLGKVYSILSDKETRSIYDETGEVDEEDVVDQDRDWYDYWRLLFSKVSVKDIEAYTQKYKGSMEELQDLKAAYLECEGDMGRILDGVLCTTADDEPRFVDILKDLICKKELPDFKNFSKESKTKKKARQKKAESEADEAEKAATELGLKDKSLTALIKNRQKTREAAADNFFAQLEAKYAEPKPKKAKTATKKTKSKK